MGWLRRSRDRAESEGVRTARQAVEDARRQRREVQPLIRDLRRLQAMHTRADGSLRPLRH
jgi:DnaJ-domain-containing protein 1